jgi:hypothetical protein
VPAAATPKTESRRTRSGAHRWLRANGDSVAANATATLANPTRLDAQEVLGHASRASQYVQRTQLNVAGLELRTAFDEYGTFLVEHPSAPQTAQLREKLRGALADVESACGAARDAAAARGGGRFGCEHPNLNRMLDRGERKPWSPSPGP